MGLLGRTAAVLACGCAVAGGTTAQALPKVAVTVDRAYFEIAEPGSNGFDTTFYPRGQGSAQWRERFRVRELGAAGTSTLDAVEAAQQAEERARCPALSSQRIEGNGTPLPVWQWYCPAAAPGLTEVQWVKPVLADGRVYFAQAQFRGPAPAGRIPAISQASWDRAFEFLRGFNACSRLSDPGCVEPAAVMGQYGDAPLSAAEQAEIARIGARGLAMHYQDQLAWHATDYVQQHKLFRPGRGGGGFLSVAGEGRGGRTWFVALKRGRVAEVVQVDTAADGTVSGTTRLPALPDDIQPRWRARQTALASADLKLCSRNANTLVLPTEDGRGWWVYVMSASTVPDQVFLGGHNRLRIDASGATIESIEYSARSCLDVDAARLRALKNSEGFVLSHLVSPLPWETDVMQSLTHAFPLTRVADSGVWRIEGDRLRKFALAPSAP